MNGFPAAQDRSVVLGYERFISGTEWECLSPFLIAPSSELALSSASFIKTVRSCVSRFPLLEIP